MSKHQLTALQKARQQEGRVSKSESQSTKITPPPKAVKGYIYIPENEVPKALFDPGSATPLQARKIKVTEKKKKELMVSEPAKEQSEVRVTRIQDTKLYKERQKREGFLRAVGNVLIEHGQCNDETFPLYDRDTLLGMLEEIPTRLVSNSAKEDLYERFNEEREDPEVLQRRLEDDDDRRNGYEVKGSELPEYARFSSSQPQTMTAGKRKPEPIPVDSGDDDIDMLTPKSKRARLEAQGKTALPRPPFRNVTNTKFPRASSPVPPTSPLTSQPNRSRPKPVPTSSSLKSAPAQKKVTKPLPSEAGATDLGSKDSKKSKDKEITGGKTQAKSQTRTIPSTTDNELKMDVFDDDTTASKKKHRPLPKLASLKENTNNPDQPVTQDNEGSNVHGGEGGGGEGDEVVQEEEQEDEEVVKKSKRKPKVTMADFHPDVQPVLRRAKKDFCAMMAADNMYPIGVDLETMIQGAWDRSNEHFYPEDPSYELTEAAKSLIKYECSRFRGWVRDQIRKEVGSTYGFQHSHSQKAVEYNCKLYEMLKRHNTFLCLNIPPVPTKPLTDKEDPPKGTKYYEHPMLQTAVNYSFFNDRRDLGPRFRYLDPFPIPTMAFIVTTIEYCLDCWREGTFRKVTFESTLYEDRYLAHIENLEEFAKRKAFNRIFEAIVSNACDSAGLDPDDIEAPVKKKGAELTDDIFGSDDEDDDQPQQKEDQEVIVILGSELKPNTAATGSDEGTGADAKAMSDEEEDQPIRKGRAGRGVRDFSPDPDAKDEMEADPQADEEG